jgi:YHS domain-containing protein
MKSNLLALRARRLPFAVAVFLVPIFPISLCAAPADFRVESPANGKSFAERSSDGQFMAKLAGLEEKRAGAIEHYNIGADKIALKGYDSVAYLTKNQAFKGRKEISAQHRGVTYWFASEENRKVFLESPEKYLPTYGGWCATAMAKGEKVEIDPVNFKVTQGRLFLFYKGLWGNARKDWDKEEAGLTAKADANWKRIAGE